MTGILAGVIRWPAWYEQSANSRAAQNNLGLDANFHYRAPWFSQIVSPYKINCNGSQSNLDLELQLAAQAGIDYFAWVWYGGETGATPTGMQTAFGMYQASSYKALVKWCAIVEPFDFGSTGSYSTQISYWVSQFSQSNYQKVLTNRPLIYILWDTNSFASNWASSYTNTSAMVSAMQTACAAASLGNPYFVIQTDYGSAAPILAGWPANAVGSYGPVSTASALPNTFSDLDALQQTNWTNMATVGSIVPNCADGWDTRPRKEHQTPWIAAGVPRSGMSAYFPQATPTQMATHLQAAVTYIDAHSSTCPANTLLTYAWDECDEGSGIIPTLGDPPVNTDTAYVTWQAAHGGPAALPTSNMLAAIGAVLRGA